MDTVIARCAGLDVHKDTVMACVRLPADGGDRRRVVQRFGTTTTDLMALRDWLASHDVTVSGWSRRVCTGSRSTTCSRTTSSTGCSMLHDGLRSCCWIVEGSGFHAAIARAILTGIRLFARRSYPTTICTSMEDALLWTLPHLSRGVDVGQLAVEAARSINRKREGASLHPSRR